MKSFSSLFNLIVDSLIPSFYSLWKVLGVKVLSLIVISSNFYFKSSVSLVFYTFAKLINHVKVKYLHFLLKYKILCGFHEIQILLWFSLFIHNLDLFLHLKPFLSFSQILDVFNFQPSQFILQHKFPLLFISVLLL